MKFNTIFKQDDPQIAAKIKAATQIRMDEAARERTRALLSEYVKMRPIRADATSVSGEPRYNRFSEFFMRHSMPAFAAVLVLAVGGGTAAAAEGALPGDILYPIKVHVNEEVQATLAFTPKAKADWAVDRAERRLEEAATLAVAGKLNDVTRAEIDTNFSAHLKAAGEDGAKLESDNDLATAAEVQTNIGATLRAHEEVLGAVSAKLSDGDKAQVDAVIASVHTAADLSAEKEVALEHKIKQEPAERVASVVKDKRTSARRHIETTKELLVRSKQRLPAETKSKAQAHLKAATDAFVAGEASDARGDAKTAFSDFNAALSGAVQTDAYVSGGLNVSDDSKNEKTATGTSVAATTTTNGEVPVIVPHPDEYKLKDL